MRDQSEVRTIIAETISTITTHELPRDFQIILHQDDQLEAPCLMIQLFGDVKVMVGIEIPFRFWHDVSVDILRAIVGIELVNYFYFAALTPLQKELIEHIESLRMQTTDSKSLVERIEHARWQFEVCRGLLMQELVRKLEGDVDVYQWFIQVGYNPSWLIEFFELMIAEAPKRTRPAGRIQPRIEAFQTRIQHMTYLMEGNVTAAETLRQQLASRVPCS